MNILLKYIRGERKGKEAHRIEREAMQDPFLAEALEGFDAVDGPHAERIASIGRRLSSRTRRAYLRTGRLAAAASLLLCLLAGGYFLLNRPVSDRFIAQSPGPVETAPEEEPASMAPSQDTGNAYRQRESARAAVPKKTASPTPVADEPVTVADVPAAVAEDYSPDEMKIEVASGEETPYLAEEEAMTPAPGAVFVPDTVVAEKVRPETRKMALADRVPEEPAEKAPPLPCPEPQTGMKAYREYLAKALIRPSEGACAGVKGTVEIQFRIDAQGNPYDFTVKRSLCPEADREAIRLIGRGCRWKGDPSQPVTVEVKF
ncbi:MAG: energy transducer TonB [Tannerella sp.]|jgi:hypothetical protein|nr:energy transducer TonB [Tannerella sp.]